MDSYGHYGQCVARIRLDHICLNQLPASSLVAFFKKRPRSYCEKLIRGPIWMAWSGFGKMHFVRKQAEVEESLGPVFGRMQLACFQIPPVHTLLYFSTDGLDHIVQNQPGSNWVLAVSGFAQTDPVWKQASVQESSGPLLANASKLMIGCGSDLACLQGKWPLDHLASEP